jgi:Zn-dependent protease
VSTRPHFSIAGIPVRVEPVFFVIAALFGLQYADIDEVLVLVWIGVTFVSILVHELGHGLALKLFGQPSSIVLHGFGGVTLSRRRLPKARSVFVSVAGSGIALLALWIPAEAIEGSDWYWEQDLWLRGAITFTAFANLWWSVANLLPIRPLDGGNVVVELFGLPAARRVSLVVAVAAGVWAFTHEQQFAGFFALFLAFTNYQEIAAERGGRDLSAFDIDGPEPPPGRGSGTSS